MNNTGLVTDLKPTRQRYVIAFVLLVVVFFSYLDRVNISILVTDDAFLTAMGIKGQSVQKGMLMTLFLIGYAAGNIVLSPLGDYLGARKAMLLAVVLWAISLIIGGVAPTLLIMFASRLLLGLGEGMHFPLQSKYIKNWFPPQERGKANSIWQVGMAIAPAMAMPFFAWIIAYTGWQGSFYSLAAMGMIPLALLWIYTSDTPRESKRINPLELEYIESALQKEAGGVSSDAVEISMLDRIKSFSGNYRFWLLVVYYVAHASILWGAMTWLPSYLKDARGFSWTVMGTLASLPWLLGIVTKITSGYLCDKFGRRAPILLLAMIGVGIGIYFGAMTQDNMTSAIFLSIGIGSLGFGGPAAWTLLQDIVPSKGVSAGAGLMNGSGNMISALAPVAIGFLISTTGSYTGGLLYLVGCAFVGGLASLVLSLQRY